MPDTAPPVIVDWSKATLRKVSVRLDGHATSFSLEESFLEALKTMALQHGMVFSRLVACIDEARPPDVGLSSALRLAVLQNACKTGT